MRAKCCLFISFLLLLMLPFTATAESLFYFPCDLEQFASHVSKKEIDLREYYRSEIDNWEDDNLMVESGSAIVLDEQLLIVDIHFSDSFDYEANYTGVPEQIMFVNHDPDVNNNASIPNWQVTVYPDKDDPYSFHYIGTYNRTMAGFIIYGSYTTPEGEPYDCFSLQVPLY